MRINVEYTDEMIKELIIGDLEKKFNQFNRLPKIEIKVRSKQNYREKEWENGELNVKLEVEL